MPIKRINSFLSLITSVALLAHIAMACKTLATGWFHPVISNVIPGIVACLVLFHAVLSICILIFVHDGSDLKYAKNNVATILQRLSAVLIIALLYFHLNAYAHVVSGISLTTIQTVLHIITELLFFAVVITHIATSVPKSFITLGFVSSESKIKLIERISYILGAVIMVAAGVSMLRYFIVGIL